MVSLAHKSSYFYIIIIWQTDLPIYIIMAIPPINGCELGETWLNTNPHKVLHIIVLVNLQTSPFDYHPLARF